MPTKLLIDESPLLVLPSLAAKIGLEEGIFLQQLHYWIEKSGHDRDGRRWVFNTYDDWSTQFTWWSIQSIRRIVNSLRQQGVIETTTAYNTIKIDKTLWYCICYDTLATLLNNDPPPAPSEPSEPSEPSDPPPAATTTVEINSPSVEINSPSVENNAPRVENNSPRVEIDTPITSRSLQETTAEDLVVVVDSDPPQKPISLPEKPRAHTRDPHPPATPYTPPLPTYDAANTHPVALDHALQHAEILDPATRAGILEANPDLTVEQILAWDAYRTRTNATNGRPLGPGALVSLLRTAAKPPRSTTDPDLTARWLTANGYLPPPEPDEPDPSVSRSYPTGVRVRPSASPTPTPPDHAADLWRRLINSVGTSTPTLAHILAHYPVQATLTDDTLTITTHPELVHHLTRPHSVLPGLLDRTLTHLANRPLTLTLVEAAAP